MLYPGIADKLKQGSTDLDNGGAGVINSLNYILHPPQNHQFLMPKDILEEQKVNGIIITLAD